MELGYLRISKADGSQVLDLQRYALLAAGVAADPSIFKINPHHLIPGPNT